ncbi:hypothetical protein [Deinococcus sonorensis]|uniref:Uncharacterized protein n=2 Tax=Deinococcus sonorensis TaxID=309891 RepID=A0AAU7UEV1_9DEIO
MSDWEEVLEERNRVRVAELREQNVELVWRKKALEHDDGHVSHHLFLEARTLRGGQKLGATGPMSYQEQERIRLINRMVSSVTGQAMHSLHHQY